jgi:serine-type D-Ala-D-Ala carboxypeptidase/endopeptidase (penicillin-binding protein 4)
MAVVALAALACPVAAAGAANDQRLAGVIAAQMRSAGGASGAWVADAETGKHVYGLASDVRRAPASVQKLLTTTTTLERFGEDERLKTVVRSAAPVGENGVVAGNVYLQGFGDPSFGAAAMAVLASRVKAAGIERIDGRVVGDDTYFDARRGLPWTDFRISIDVGPLSALSFNEGTLRGFGGGFQPNPPLFVAQRLKAWLSARGVAVKRAARAGNTPPAADLVASVRSPTIRKLARRTNQPSDNYYAETLLKGLGARFGGSGSTTAGAGVVRHFTETLGVSSQIADGSGLSRANAISPAAVGRLLLAARERPWFRSFERSLPLAAHTGTLRKRMRRTAAAGRCRAKTGTLRGVSAIAGYCRSRAGRTFAFALLMNAVNIYRARAAQDRIAAALASG